MTTVTPGTGATILSDNAEQQLLDCIALIKNWEKIPAKNPNNGNTINCSFSLSSGIANITFQIPALPSINDLGQQVQNPASYLINTDFTPGTGGTFKSLTVEGYFLEVLSYLEIVEGNPNKNPNQNNYISSSFDSDARNANGNATIPIVFELGDGFVKTMANEYLLD
ncbi:hypothetical protein [Brunnivagina elsteri]|uniref:Uncharacterized protein n=1 Tax=Brunnivagina elsteri CCALA 953 TaxID=987040 RepID=A0A2A2TE86_9CYAN|nr:hypothetical protein [Calothrix elsteri]PAX52011.1 hypothetical protein CK510_21650 [Calothrix elsteri CCALA 953]